MLACTRSRPMRAERKASGAHGMLPIVRAHVSIRHGAGAASSLIPLSRGTDPDGLPGARRSQMPWQQWGWDTSKNSVRPPSTKDAVIIRNCTAWCPDGKEVSEVPQANCGPI